MARKKKQAKIRMKPTSDSISHESYFRAEAGELWIDPNLNRKIFGPGGNRGEHTTPIAELLKLAEIALRKKSSQ